MPDDREPTSWELMRGIERLEKSIATLSSGVVTQVTFAMYQSAQAERDKEQDKKITALEADRDEQRKTKAQQWFAIGLAALTAVGGLVTALIVWTITRGT